jgi:hypothetical protein
MKSARVWPLSSFASTASSTDFHRAGDEQAARLAQARQQFAMLQQMLDLDGRVVGEIRELAMQRVHDAHGVRGPVEEIGIAEGDVLGARGHLLANVGEHDLGLHHPKAPLIHRHHRAMAAQMFAASAGFGVAGRLDAARFAAARIFREAAAGPQRDLELQRSSEISGSVVASDPRRQALQQRNQTGSNSPPRMVPAPMPRKYDSFKGAYSP